MAWCSLDKGNQQLEITMDDIQTYRAKKKLKKVLSNKF
jgi:hypothetical protein